MERKSGLAGGLASNVRAEYSPPSPWSVQGRRILGRIRSGVQSHVVRLNVVEGPLQNSRRRRLGALSRPERQRQAKRKPRVTRPCQSIRFMHTRRISFGPIMKPHRLVLAVLAAVVLSACNGDDADPPPGYLIAGDLPSEIKILAGGPASMHFRAVHTRRSGVDPATNKVIPVPNAVTLGVGPLPAGITGAYVGAAAGVLSSPRGCRSTFRPALPREFTRLPLPEPRHQSHRSRRRRTR